MINEYKKIIRDNLNNTLSTGFVPELGKHKSGKVRDIHFTSLEVGEPIIMIASDRVSSFDHILDRCIPFKGQVLNMFNEWAFKNTVDIIPNASLKSPHPNVLIQKYAKNIMVECVVRGYVWGSLAGEYEQGDRIICGLKFGEGLLRYGKLTDPIFTPTTKSEHDEAMTYSDVEKQIGEKLAKEVKDIAIKLYKRGAELAEKSGMIFIDTKYEFGVDDNGVLHLIDEANTPDSSRYCSIEEYEKFKSITTEMATGVYKNVSDLLEKKPALKIKEMSKQFVRDVLIEKGFSYGSTGAPPSLDDEDVVEVSYRYIELYETLTGEKFKFPGSSVRQGLIDGLRKAGYIKGGIAIIMAGSDSDMLHVDRIKNELNSFGIPSSARICSAHKQPTSCEEIVKKYNSSLEPTVIIGVAGGTDALSGVASFHSVHPVISCPPDPLEYQSCIKNPPGSSNSLILRPANVARHVAQIFSSQIPGVKDKIIEKNNTKIDKLIKADEAN